MTHAGFPPQVLPPGSPADNAPSAPTGTIFVIGPEGGYAVPPCRFTLLFGRNREDVHVPVGIDDPAVSRYHGEFTCAGPGEGWWLSNTGNLPIELPYGAVLLNGHTRAVEPGCTPLVINSSHLLEVHVIKDADRLPRSAAKVDTAKLDTVHPQAVYKLSQQERLVLTALAKSYLEGHERYPQPRTWQETADLANASPHATKTWGPKTVANTAEDIRDRLHRRGVRGLFRDEVGSNVGATLSINLIRELLRTATLSARDLELLGPRD